MEMLRRRGNPVENVRIILDRAQWHLAKTVTQSMFAQNLIVGVTKRPEMNLIERVFSKLRELFRRRPEVETFEEEQRIFQKIVRECNKERDFLGYQLETLRTVRGLTEECLKLSGNRRENL